MKRDDTNETRERSASDSAPLVARAGDEIRRQLAAPLAAGLYLVATPIGNLGDVTLRALTTLSRADLICCEDTRHSRTLLAHFGIDRPLRPYHEHNAEAERPRLLHLLAEGKAIALISDAGTPLISDPGYKLVRAVLEAGHLVTALPGASALLTGLSLAGLPTDAFHFAGFLPPKDVARRKRLEELASVPATLVLYEAPNRVGATLAAIADVLGDREVAVARELTKRFEEVHRGHARALADTFRAQEVKGEIVLIIGPPVAAISNVTDDAISSALQDALLHMSLKDAVQAVAETLSVPRNRVYSLGLKLKAGRDAS